MSCAPIAVVFTARGAGTIVGDMQQAGISLRLADRGNLQAMAWVGGGYKHTVADHPLDLGRPHHAATVFDPDRRQLRLYLDGVLQGTPLAIEGVFKPSPYRMTLAADLTHYTGRPGPAPDHRFEGDIEEVRISQGARYTTNFKPQWRLASEKSTLLLYHFDEGRGTEAYDSSGNGLHGTIEKGRWVTRPVK